MGAKKNPSGEELKVVLGLASDRTSYRLLQRIIVVKKSEITKRKIIDGAVYCLTHLGERETTFQRIADHCGVSQPLVVKYLKSREGIFDVVLEEIIEKAKTVTSESIKGSNSSTEALQRYFSASAEIVESDENTARFLLLLHYLAGKDPKFKQIKSLIKKNAIDRIYGILERGVTRGEFHPTLNIKDLALLIHNSIIGTLINVLTEKNPPPLNETMTHLSRLILRELQVS